MLSNHSWDKAQALTYITKTVSSPLDIADGTSEAEGSELED